MPAFIAKCNTLICNHCDCHCEPSGAPEARQSIIDCFVASTLLAMTMFGHFNLRWFYVSINARYHNLVIMQLRKVARVA